MDVAALNEWLDACFQYLDGDTAAQAKDHFLTRSRLIPAKESYVYELRCRARDAQSLVNKFIVYIREGCTNSECTTPYCFSKVKRVSKAPVRKPTVLTARMQAYTLASEPHAVDLLCPNPPVVTGRLRFAAPSPSEVPFEVPGPPTENSRKSEDPLPAILADSPDQSKQAQPPGKQALPSSGKRTKVDRKSLSQNLFNNASIHSFEYMNFEHFIESTPDQAVITPIDASTLHGLEALVNIARSGSERKDNHLDSIYWYIGLLYEIDDPPDAGDSMVRFAISTLYYNLSTPTRIMSCFPSLRQGSSLDPDITAMKPIDPNLVGALRHLARRESTVTVISDALSQTLLSTTRRGHEATLNDDEIWHIILVCVHFLIALGDPISKEKITMNPKNPSEVAQFEMDNDTEGTICTRTANFARVLLRFVRSHEKGSRRESFSTLLTVTISKACDIEDFLALYVTIADLIMADRGELPVIREGSDLHLALEIHESLYQAWTTSIARRMPNYDIRLPNLVGHIPEVQMAESLLAYHDQPGTRHLISFPSLFSEKYLTGVFRATCYLRMRASFKTALSQRILLDRVRVSTDSSWQNQIESRFAPALSKCLILEVNRETLLEDSFDQIWGKEPRELLRPFKVMIGGEYNEMGDDHGGPTREFFRFVFEKAFSPEVGLFIVDEVSGMPWFDPMSREPLATYEMLGLLVSLAIHNGVHAPINLPLAFYTAVRDDDFDPELALLKDGWPQLHENMQRLLEWNDGDVGDIFSRTFAFSVRDCDRVYEINMYCEEAATVATEENYKDCSFPQLIAIYPELSEPAPLVTNSNRVEFVRNYVAWLTKRSIYTQLSAFIKGFKQYLDPKALKLVPSASMLKYITEGQPYFSFDAIRQITAYKGFTADHPLMKSFWRIVLAYPLEKQKKLLEFVTASDRIPVQGVKSMLFVIEETFEATDRLPSSQTCFSTLKMPEYEDEQKLREKLDVVLEFGARGFGVG